MADAAKPNDAGLFFVDAEGNVVPEGNSKAVQQFSDEDLRTLSLGPYATEDQKAKRVAYAATKARNSEETANKSSVDTSRPVTTGTYARK